MVIDDEILRLASAALEYISFDGDCECVCCIPCHNRYTKLFLADEGLSKDSIGTIKSWANR